MADRPSVAFLGTGIMGAPMARHVAQAGLQVRAWNRTPEKAQPLAEHGVEVADAAAEAVRGAGVVVTMLTDGAAVESVMTGAGGLEAMDDGAVWAQMSTVGLHATERLAGLAAERGVDYVDAPVLGTRQPAEEAQLVVLAAGPSQARARCRPVFAAVGQTTRELDQVGQASRLKLVLNTWLVGVVESLAETIALARALDVDPRHFLDTIEGGALDCGYAHLKGDLMIEESFEPAAFPLALAAKDAELVLEAAEQTGIRLTVVAAVRDQFARAREQGLGEADMAAVYRASRPS
jgi:3-hydroxyisobutyrate dehydrogenase